MLALSHPQVTDLMQQSFRHACHISTNAQLQMANTPDCYPPAPPRSMMLQDMLALSQPQVEDLIDETHNLMLRAAAG